MTNSLSENEKLFQQVAAEMGMSVEKVKQAIRELETINNTDKHKKEFTNFFLKSFDLPKLTGETFYPKPASSPIYTPKRGKQKGYSKKRR